MECNLLQNSYNVYNLDIGTVAFDFYQTQGLIGLAAAPPVTLFSGSILCFDIDLMDRIYADELKYTFTHISGTQNSDIEISYKNYSFDTFNELITTYEDGYYSTTFTGSASYPRYIRLKHTLNDQSGYFSSITLSNNDSIVNFGSDGQLDSDNVYCSRGLPYIREIKIYNNNNATATASIQLEALNIYLDKYIAISTSPEGPWLSVLGLNNCIANSDSWSLGTLGPMLVEVRGELTLNGEEITGAWASNVEEAFYTTRIFNLTNKTYSNLYLPIWGDDLGCRVCTDYADSVSTIEVRSLSKPLNYSIYRTIYSQYNNSSYNYFYKDYDTSTDTLITNSTEVLTNNGALTDYIVTINKIGITAILACSSSAVILVVLNVDSSLKYERDLLSVADNGNYIYHVEPDYNQGAWVYVYCAKGSTSYPMNQDGYFLFHYNYLNQQTFKMSASVRGIYHFSVIENSGHIWYTSLSEVCLIQLNEQGTVIYSLVDDTRTNDLRGCCSLPDGGCWYINGSDLHRVNLYGDLVDSILNVSSLGTLAHVVVHTDGSLFVRDGNYIYRISTLPDSKGFKHFTVLVPYADKLVAATLGVWVYCTTGFMYYLSEANGNVIKTVGATLSNQVRLYGFIDKAVEEVAWAKKFPTTLDPLWSIAPYNKTQTNLYYFSKELYHQAKITLRSNKPYNKYDVPYSESIWDISDSFNNEIGYTIPYKHRWVSHSDVYIEHIAQGVTVTSGIPLYIDKGMCKLPGYIGNPIANYFQYVTSKDRWYLKDYYTEGAFDLFMDYMIPESNNQDFILNLKVTPTYNYNIGMMCAFVKRVSGTLYCGYFVSGWRIDSANDINTYTEEVSFNDYNFNYGRLRVKHSTNMVYIYTYNFFSDLWEQRFSCTLQRGAYSSGDIRFNYWRCYNVIVDYKGIKPIYISDFTKAIADIYWYNDSPRLKGIYLQDYITLDNIYPNNYKSIYIKTDVPLNDINYVAEDVYDYKLRVWWELQL